MAHVPNVVLWLLSPGARARANLQACAARAGVGDDDRVRRLVSEKLSLARGEIPELALYFGILKSSSNAQTLASALVEVVALCITADQLLTVARGLGYEHRDIAGLFEVLSHLADDETHSLA